MTLTATLVGIDTFSLFIRPSKCASQWSSVNKQASESGNQSTYRPEPRGRDPVYIPGCTRGLGGGQSIWRDGGHGINAKDTCYVYVMRHKTNSRPKYPPSILKPKYSCQLVKYLIMNSSRMKLMPKIHAS